ncbi:MAG: hypothetical protein DLM50_05120 [Candidatus Meridianibacter frigidus]|nr:MAG: hypothetical protein DLM50_05120 [Candidatus Eremiobacteraeota bacterium]
MNTYLRAAGAVLAVLLLAGCGGNKTTSTTTSTVTASPMSEGQREQNALPLTAAQPVPAGLNCGATQPVWVNLKSKAYHEPADPYYGRTKNGKYMCPSAASQAGFHPAGSHAGNESGQYGRMRHHKHRSSSSY